MPHASVCTDGPRLREMADGREGVSLQCIGQTVSLARVSSGLDATALTPDHTQDYIFSCIAA